MGRKASGTHPPWLEALLADLQAQEARARSHAILIMLKRQAVEAAGEVLGALGDPDPWVRWSAVAALRSIGGTECVPALTTALSDDAWQVRGSAAAALGRLAGPETAAALVPLLSDEEAGVRAGAAWAIGELDPAPYADLLAGLLADEDLSVRYEAAASLNHILDRRGYVALKQLLPLRAQHPFLIPGRFAKEVRRELARRWLRRRRSWRARTAALRRPVPRRAASPS